MASPQTIVVYGYGAGRRIYATAYGQDGVQATLAACKERYSISPRAVLAPSTLIGDARGLDQPPLPAPFDKPWPVLAG